MVDFAASHPLRVFVTFGVTLELGQGVGAVGARVAEGRGEEGRGFRQEWASAFLDESGPPFLFLVDEALSLERMLSTANPPRALMMDSSVA